MAPDEQTTDTTEDALWPSLAEVWERLTDERMAQWDEWRERDGNRGMMSLPEAMWLGWDAAIDYREARLRSALVECAVVLEALHMAGGTGITTEIAGAVAIARNALGLSAPLKAGANEEVRDAH